MPYEQAMHHSDPDIRSRLTVAHLPAMPQILLKLIEHCQADKAGMAELADLIAKDAAMVARIIGIANSSAYHRSGRLFGLEQSLIALGTDMVKMLLISESVRQIFSNFSRPNGTDLRAFWKHSLMAAIAARMIAVKIGYMQTEEAYLAGLLHDAGRLALLATVPGEYTANFFVPDDDDLCITEQRTLQITHAEAGAWLIERWNLDSFLADSVLYHHEPQGRPESAHPLIRIVAVAHLLANPSQDDPILETAGTLCGLTADELTAIRNHAIEEVWKTAEYLGIELDDTDNSPTPAMPTSTPVSATDTAKERLTEQVHSMMLASEAGRSFTGQ